MENILALMAATAVLVAIPGPNVAFIVAQCLRHGLGHGLITVAATTLGVGMQLLLVICGLAVALQAAAAALVWIKWFGVAYLLWLGIRTWRARAEDSQESTSSTARTALQGLLMALLNPKTLVFNAAFLPQFIGRTDAPLRELGVLAVAYLAVILLGDVLWSCFASVARGWLVRIGRWRNRLVGSLLFGAGVGLALTRHEG